MPRHDGMGSKGAPPAPRLVVRSSCFEHPKSDIHTYVHQHPFNNAMELLLPVLPGTKAKQLVVTNTDALGAPQPFFQGFRAPLSTFVSSDFLSTYIKSGAEFVAISNATPIDRTDAAAVSPDGKLHLALTKQSYETLGLVGTTSAFQPHQRHNITIDLRAKSLVPGRKLHDRVQECFAKRAGSLEFLCLCVKDGKPLEVSAKGGVTHRLEREDRTLESLQLPILTEVREDALDGAQPMEFDWGMPEASSWGDPPGAHNGETADEMPSGQEQPGQKTEEETSGAGQRHDRKETAAEGDPLTDEGFVLALHEWLGAIACGAAGTEVRADLAGARGDLGQPDVDRDWFAGCHVDTQKGGVRAVRWTGLIAPSQILSCMAFARKMIEEKRVPWAALTVWGFADAPVSWHGAEHGYAQSGENDYSLVMLDGGRYLLYSAACGHDAMKLG